MVGNSQANAAPSTGHKILREGKVREVGRHGKIRSQYLFPITFLDAECQKISNNQAFIHVPQQCKQSQKEVLALLCSIFSPEQQGARVRWKVREIISLLRSPKQKALVSVWTHEPGGGQE